MGEICRRQKFTRNVTLATAALLAVLNVSSLVQADGPYSLWLAALQQSDTLPAPAATADAPSDAETGSAGGDELDKMMNMDLDQLQNVSVTMESTPGALTEVPNDRNIVPAAVTRITKEDIWRSGARNLDEVLEIFVPNLEISRHHWEQTHLGLRGIINDREDKYLLLVNDRIMNEKTHYGAASERLLPELADIDHIDVVRGPGSAVYGPGAVSMVIAIYTETAKTFQGTTARVRGGVFDSFGSLEMKHASQWEDAEGGIYLYGGVGYQNGANGTDAPLILGTSDPGFPGFGNPTTQYQGAVAGRPVPRPGNRDMQSFNNVMPLKFFVDVTYNDWEIWARFTRSGMEFPLATAAGLAFDPVNAGNGGFGTFVTQQQSWAANQQMTVQSRYDTELDEDTRFIYMLGWDSTDFARNLFFGTAEAYSEQELNTRAILVKTLGDHQIAVGGEFYNDWFGLDSHLVAGPPVNGRLGANFDPWVTQTYSALFEDQWQITDEWTLFMGGRWDKNTYTPWMYSPRAAIVYTPEDYIAWKFIANRSQRMNFAEELRAQWLATRTLSDPEILRSYELRYERSPTDYYQWAVSAFYIDLDAISWDGTTSSAALTGNQTQWGLEGELQYEGKRWDFIASQSYTKLIKFTLFDPNVTTFITAAPNGFGNDLSAWSPFITKVFARRHLTEHWNLDSSLRYYWGFPGSRDIQRRTNATPGAFSQTAPNWNRPWEDAVFLNLGLEYRYSRNTRFRIDGYNLLGAFDKDINRRPYYGDNDFVSEAIALGISGETTY